MIGVETSLLVVRLAKQQVVLSGEFVKGKDRVRGPETLEPRDRKTLR